MKAHELLSSPEKWTKGALAKDADGNTVSACHPKATCFCVLGAVEKCYPDLNKQIQALNLLEYTLGERISRWNDRDSVTHSDVHNLLKELDV